MDERGSERSLALAGIVGVVLLAVSALIQGSLPKPDDPVGKIAKFLVDNQGPQGFWSYGSPSIYVEDITYDVPKRKDVASAGGKADTGGVKQFELPQPGMRGAPGVR